MIHVLKSILQWVSLAILCMRPKRSIGKLLFVFSPISGMLWNLEAYSDSSYASNCGDQKSISRYCTFVGWNLVTWWSNKQHIVSLFSSEAKYHAMMHACSEMLWVLSFLQEIGFPVHAHVLWWTSCNLSSNNPTFHERTKHIEIDCHAICHQVLDGFITTHYVGSSHQLVDILTKGLSTAFYDSISCKLGLFDLYSQAWGGVWVYMGHNVTFVILDFLLSPLTYMSLFSSLLFLNQDHYLYFIYHTLNFNSSPQRSRP